MSSEETDERGDAERFNDEHIAPELARLSRLAADHGLSFTARVEWAPFEGQTTMSKTPGVSASHHLAYLACRANGNVDEIIMSLAREHHAGVIDLSASILRTYLNLPPFAAKRSGSDKAPSDGGSNG